ncbi:MAG: type II secretion system secretin GspD, partial [Coxiellaceae bacterium]|nr:type II secretion system secretin GspD [Coxiellaceae bacterium]
MIQTVSLLTGKSFVIDPRVKGKVTFLSQKAMTTQEIYQAFLSMLQVLGYAAIPSGHVIKIVPAMEAKGYGGMLASHAHPGRGDQVVVRVIPINHVSASQLVPVLRSMMPPWASVSAYMPSNSLILVGSAANLSRLVSVIGRMDSQGANIMTIVPLKHANAKNLVNILQSLQSGARAEGRIVNVAMAADEQSNSVLLNGNLENINRMKSLILRLDRPVSGGNTMVVHLNYLVAKKLAPILLKVATGEGASKDGKTDALGEVGVSVQAEENDNAVILHGPASVLKSLRKVIRELDVRPSQVLVEAIIVKVDQTLLNQLGIVWGTVDSSGSSTSVVDPTTGVSSAGTVSSPNTFALKVTHGVGFISGGNLSVLIHALKSNTSTDILATPSIVVLNNKEATISDGKNIGIVNRQYSSTVAGSNNEITPFNTVQRKDVTLSLKVTPQISPNHIIRLKIQQQNDTVDPSSTGDMDNPVLDVSKITTNVL